MTAKKITVMIVDDSAVVRTTLTKALEHDPIVESIDTASDPIFAMKRMEEKWPDVIILDIEMPRMDGITFLKKIMAERPTPVVICSSLAQKGVQVSLDALEAGAVDIISKPKFGLKDFLTEGAEKFIHSVHAAANSHPALLVRAREKKLAADTKIDETVKSTEKEVTESQGEAPAEDKRPATKIKTTENIYAIGTSTGGTTALETILVGLHPDCPGIVVVQHMPEEFTAAFAARLNEVSAIQVKEARDGDEIIRGQAIIARGNRHLLVKRSGARYYVQVKDGPTVSRHRPSVDVLFRSMAEAAGENGVGMILTGMGDDGAHGLEEMHNQGAYTIAQDEKSCVVFGMPKEAIARNAVDKVLPLDLMAPEIMRYDHYGRR